VKSDPRNRGKEDSGAKKQLKIIYSLMKRNDVDMIISACDFDREGQIIGDTIIYNLKTQKKVYRLLQNEWTPEDATINLSDYFRLLKGLQNIKPTIEMRLLLDAGISRQWADWVIGIKLNISRNIAVSEWLRTSPKYWTSINADLKSYL
jgi:DNA topoisomerase III